MRIKTKEKREYIQPHLWRDGSIGLKRMTKFTLRKIMAAEPATLAYLWCLKYPYSFQEMR